MNWYIYTESHHLHTMRVSVSLNLIEVKPLKNFHILLLLFNFYLMATSVVVFVQGAETDKVSKYARLYCTFDEPRALFAGGGQCDRHGWP